MVGRQHNEGSCIKDDLRPMYFTHASVLTSEKVLDRSLAFVRACFRIEGE
jgi:hypothetical protein